MKKSELKKLIREEFLKEGDDYVKSAKLRSDYYGFSDGTEYLENIAHKLNDPVISKLNKAASIIWVKLGKRLDILFNKKWD